MGWIHGEHYNREARVVATSGGLDVRDRKRLCKCGAQIHTIEIPLERYRVLVQAEGRLASESELRKQAIALIDEVWASIQKILAAPLAKPSRTKILSRTAVDRAA